MNHYEANYNELLEQEKAVGAVHEQKVLREKADMFDEITRNRSPEGFFQWKHEPAPQEESKSKYDRELRDGTVLDVYDVLDAFNITNPGLQHAIKKMLCSGLRGHKDFEQDIEEAIESLQRALSFPPK